MYLRFVLRIALLTLPLAAVLAAPVFQERSLPTEASTDPVTAYDQLTILAQAAVTLQKSKVKFNQIKREAECTLDTLAIRREWGALSKDERKEYLKAVRCLQAKGSNTPVGLAPGAKTRYDDFVATHINQTLTIHFTGNFLSWHRYFTWSYEQALRNECGYTGYQPYWDWAKTAANGVESSPIFDGSDTSMSGNGAPIANQGNFILGIPGFPAVIVPSGSGGGCVTSGAFKDLTVNLGPGALALSNGSTISNPTGPLSYNPRCLKRDLTDYINQRYANASSVTTNIVAPQTIADFQGIMQGIPGSGELGIHGGGHFTIGGDPGRDAFTSPGDPAFFLHHGMIDRVWWIWQMLNPAERVVQESTAIAGTNTFLNNPPSANTTFEDLIDLGYAAGPPRKIGDLMSTVGGPFCYIYI